ncbi:MAG TPA: asparaginase [Microthrixaceae bacterium]|nr:asparaginase [Microthrixaceae bacterium]HMS11620.1 asparaginase [Microthrixaceae bacterium]HMT22827.1 asparaginase [Microthrixaceae bacterium]HMT59587.1 asparaginase [Microthrixaceae bacterium]
MLYVDTFRAGYHESEHRVWGCRIDPTGAVIDEISPGDAGRRIFLRSAAKPFQAAPAIAAGVLERFGLDDRHLAVAVGSHCGTEPHVTLVREILAAAGLDDSAVTPGDDGQGGPLQHQCSGNHALALAWCAAESWPTANYLDADHPVQLAMNAAVSAATGEAIGDGLDLAPDNCGMTSHRVTLRAMAVAYGRLASNWPGLAGLARVAHAMRSHPDLVRRRGEVDTELMCADGSVVAKVGAEAAIGIGTRDGSGIAVRTGDGAPRTWSPAGVAVSDRWLGEGRRRSLDPLRRPPLFDAKGAVIGHIEARWSD